MKRIPFYLMIAGALFSLVLAPACSTTEEAVVYDLTGNWQIITDFGIGPTVMETFIFTGSLTTGLANNITDGTNGVYTVNNTAVQIILSYWEPTCWDVTETFTGTFSSPTAMSGTVQFGASGPCMAMAGVTFTAVKL